MGEGVDISVVFNIRKYGASLQFSFVKDDKIFHFNKDGVENSPYPNAHFDQEEIKSLILFLNESLLPSSVREPDYETQRGISVHVDTNPYGATEHE